MMNILKNSSLHLNRKSKVFLLVQSTLVSFSLFMFGYVEAFEMGSYEYFFYGFGMMLVSLLNLILAFMILNYGDK